jgi:hypothetical protein
MMRGTQHESFGKQGGLGFRKEACHGHGHAQPALYAYRSMDAEAHRGTGKPRIPHFVLHNLRTGKSAKVDLASHIVMWNIELQAALLQNSGKYSVIAQCDCGNARHMKIA